MPLPKIATPSYELELPSTGKTITYRPFLVKEEKLLVIALESEDTKQITNAIKAVIRACILSKGIKVEALPTFDIEYLFLNIRGKSVGEDLDVKLICPDDNQTEVNVNINLDDIQVQKPEGHSNQIKLDNNLIMELKYPSLNEFIKNNFDPNEVGTNAMEQSFDLIGSCINKIYNEDEVWIAADCSKKEINDLFRRAEFEFMVYDYKSTSLNDYVKFLKLYFNKSKDLVGGMNAALSQLIIKTIIKNELGESFYLSSSVKSLIDELIIYVREELTPPIAEAKKK